MSCLSEILHSSNKLAQECRTVGVQGEIRRQGAAERNLGQDLLGGDANSMEWEAPFALVSVFLVLSLLSDGDGIQRGGVIGQSAYLACSKPQV